MNRIESLYIHFPFCAHLCNYCDFYKKVSPNLSQDLSSFHSYLQNSFNEHERLMKENGYSWAPLKTLYIGGGTPSLWGLEGAFFLQKFLTDNSIILAPDCEFTLEVNPGAWNERVLGEWEKIGVNRYSLGIQSLDGTLSKYLDRVHSIDDVFDTLNFFNQKRHNFSVDFMLGLPFSEPFNRNVMEELNRALSYNPSHFSVYILTVKNNYTHYSHLPSEEWIEKEYLDVANFLKKNNYLHYEVSNFSLKNRESRHNLSYWKSQTVAALGPSATGFLSEKKLRYKWKPNAPLAELENLTDSEFLLEKIYMNLRSSVGLDLNFFSHIEDIDSKFVNRWVSEGKAIVDEKRHLTLTSKGYLLLDSLMNELFSLKIIK